MNNVTVTVMPGNFHNEAEQAQDDPVFHGKSLSRHALMKTP
jgi:hypothetical protein